MASPAFPLRLALAAALLCAASPAFAQATRTWVSGVGDDVNPCSRTAPCRTFAGALPKTASGGEIDALDAGDFGPVTVTRSVTLDGRGVGRVLAEDAHAVVVNAPGATVVLRNLSLQGARSGLDGLRVLAARSVRVEDSRVSGFTGDGLRFTPDAGGQLLLRNVSSADNAGAGLRVGSLSGSAVAFLERASLQRGSQGLVVEAGGRATAYDVTASGNAGAGLGVRASGAGASAELNVERAQLSHNALALEAVGLRGASAQVRLSRATALGSSLAPTRLAGEGSLGSYGNNRLDGLGAAACTLEPAALAPAALETAYGPVELALRGGLGRAQLSLTGALPRGMQASGGVLEGTPTEGGDFPLTLTGTDDNGCSVQRSLVLSVPCPATSVDPDSVPGATAGEPYEGPLFSHTGAQAPSTLQLMGTLPIGLGLVDGRLKGLPTQPGTFLFRVGATDAHRCAAERSYTLEVVRPADYQDTTAQLSATPSPAAYGQSLTLTARLAVASGEPTGSVAFFATQGAGPERALGVAPVSARGASLVAPSLEPGAYSLRAVYSGDAHFSGAEAPALALKVSPAQTQTALASAGPVDLDTPARLSATVTSSGAAGTPTGLVTFREGERVLGSAALDAAGVATLEASLLGAGTHSLVAAYAGAERYLPSTSAPLAQEVRSARVEAQGCGCSEASAPGLASPLLLLALRALRRRRRTEGGERAP
ncbi:Ig-like domain repeat protein [Aggregicoccus sp. 17bor-14]|uniref:Ig-like domain-containing protein n=1 Tax=Myxococcaceae TaxID=31 RepID=UPI00129C5CEC|nr:MULTISPECIES: Ig-like domain-containing protein [Myxococcaceae]MBF5045232.1 Ig-like domain repeat protein [Simulacricoccus sp. 17bor-14]MRI90973.1 Ig-like domain repeat protein [Aggregicoccus sp. 17bor-14]